MLQRTDMIDEAALEITAENLFFVVSKDLDTLILQLADDAGS